MPSEERIELSGEFKRAKYEKLVDEGKRNVWRVRLWAAEVGCRGFPAASVVNLMKDLGYQGKERQKVVRKVGQAAEIASHSIWRWSHNKEWGRNEERNASTK